MKDEIINNIITVLTITGILPFLASIVLIGAVGVLLG